MRKISLLQRIQTLVLTSVPSSIYTQEDFYMGYAGRKVIYNKLRTDIRGYIQDLCRWKGVERVEGHLMPDHVHLLISIPPKMNISSFMGYLKGKSSMMIFKDHANLRYKYGNCNFWATGYYVSTVGLNEATIRKYIRDQEKEDVLEDKLTKRESHNPFKGLLQ